MRRRSAKLRTPTTSIKSARPLWCRAPDSTLARSSSVERGDPVSGFLIMVAPEQDPTLYLTHAECTAKAEECRELSARAATERHRVMLSHMAETWERICAEIKLTEPTQSN
jgi:hypothetical protein